MTRPAKNTDLCPECGTWGAAVVDSRPYDPVPGWRRRRRRCDCGHRWTTLEVPEGVISALAGGEPTWLVLKKLDDAIATMTQVRRLMSGKSEHGRYEHEQPHPERYRAELPVRPLHQQVRREQQDDADDDREAA